jgi:hypothetical protein
MWLGVLPHFLPSSQSAVERSLPLAVPGIDAQHPLEGRDVVAPAGSFVRQMMNVSRSLLPYGSQA